jgi:hypothetical protein
VRLVGMRRLCNQSQKIVSKRRPKRPNQIVMKTIDGSSQAPGTGTGTGTGTGKAVPNFRAAGVLFAGWSEVIEKWCGHI